MHLLFVSGIACLVSMDGVAVAVNPPHATLLGTTIHLEPSGGAFAVPDDWMEWYRHEPNNLHLSRTDLRKVKDGAAYWDADYSRVVNATLPFERCAVHAGGEGWGAESRSIADLQMRAYLGDWSVKAVQTFIAEKGLPTARSISHRQTGASTRKVVFRKDVVSGWHHTVISFPVKYRDAVDEIRGGANVEFYVRSFGVETVVLVFMYSDPCSQKKFIQTIISSFNFP